MSDAYLDFVILFIIRRMNMDLLKNMNEALEYIECNFTEKIDYIEVAKIAVCSEYHFNRMFSFLAGVNLSEYVRRRRLTLAALDLKIKI